MPTPTYTLIASNTLSSSAASVTFSAIPGTYTDLVVRVSARTDRATNNDLLYVQFSGDTATNYSIIRLSGTGSAAASTTLSNNATPYIGYLDANTSTANTFGSLELYVPNYTSSANKPFGSFGAEEENATGAFISVQAGLWRNSSAVSSMVFGSYFGANFVSGSSFFLYGIKNS